MRIRNLFDRWIRKTIDKTMMQSVADQAATYYIATILPQHVRAGQNALAADSLLEFLEQGQCSPQMQERLVSWVNIVAAKMNGEGDDASAQNIIWRLAKFQTSRRVFSGAQPHPLSTHE